MAVDMNATGSRWMRAPRRRPFLSSLARFLFLILVPLGLIPVRAGASAPAVRQLLIAGSAAASEGTRASVFIIGFDPTVERFATQAAGMVNPIALALTPERHLLIADDRADPLHLGTGYGAVWEVDPAIALGAPARVALASQLFRKISDILLEKDGHILVLDSEADPSGWGHHNGCIFRADPATAEISILAAPQVFSDPRRMIFDLDGSLLVADPTANPLAQAQPAGAIFRVNPRTGVVTLERAFTKPALTGPTALAVIDHGVRRGDYLVVDPQADPLGHGTATGGVFLMARSGGAPTFFAAAPSFAGPADIITGLEDDFWVLDPQALSAQAPNGRGMLFRFRLQDGVLRQEPKFSNAFRNLNSLVQLSGAALDSSAVTWTDESPGWTSPGDYITVRARLRNNGTEDAPQVSLRDTLRATVAFVPGSDSIGAGRTSFNPLTGEFAWSSPLARDAETSIRFRFRINDNVAAGQRIDQRVALRVGSALTYRIQQFYPQVGFSGGAITYFDIRKYGLEDEGAICIVGADSTQPGLLFHGYASGILKRPSDAAFLDDGRLVILDPNSPAGGMGALLAYSLNSSDTLSVFLQLRLQMGFVHPSGLTADRDGSLLITDRDANPNAYPYPLEDWQRLIGDQGPGAVFRYDPSTQEFSVAAASPDFHQPLDAVVDRNGDLVIVDRVGGTEHQGSLWEVSHKTGAIREIELPAALFKDPSAVAVDVNNNLYVCSQRAVGGPNPNGGAVFEVRRGPPVTISVATADTVLRQPTDLFMTSDGKLLISDREANPLGFPTGPGTDRGAVFKLNLADHGLRTVASSGLTRQPDGVAERGWADLAGSLLSLENSRPGFPVPGDTLRAEALLINRGTASASRAMAVLTLDPSTLRLLPADSTQPGLGVDTLSNRASWTGRVDWGDTMRVSVRGVVRSGNSYGSSASVRLDIQGGRSPFALVKSRPIRAEFLPNDVLVADHAADPYRLGSPYGAVFGIGPGALDGRRLVYSQTTVTGLSALEWESAGSLLIAADRGTAPGLLYRFSTVTGVASQIGAADTLLKTPVDLLRASNGDLLIVDRDAWGPTPQSRGAILTRTGNGPLSVFCSDSLFRAPLQACYGPNGLIYLADRDADPEHRGGNTGAVFTIDPSTRKVTGWLQDPRIDDPSGVTPYAANSVLVTDPVGSTPSNPRGTLVVYRPADGSTSIILELANLRSLWRSLRLPTGEVLMLDRGARHSGSSGLGVVWGYDPTTNGLREYSWSDSFAQVSDLVMKPGPTLRFVRHDWTDVNGGSLHPADRVRFRSVLQNVGETEAARVAYRDSLPEEGAYIPESATATAGVISFAGSQDLSWNGPIAPGDSVVISYEVQLNPAVSEGKILVFHPTATDGISPPVDLTTKLQTYVPLETGHLYLVDADADPFHESASGQKGALFKVNMVTGSAVPMLTSRSLRKPKSVALVGSSASPVFLILDSWAYNQYLRQGTLFLYDPVTQVLRNLGGHRTFRKPVKVLPWSDTEALVLDQSADPDSFYSGETTGPGALYKVNLVTSLVTPIFSDTTLRAPSSMTWLAPGVLAIADEGVDPNGSALGRGAVFRLELATGDLRLFATSTLWRSPTALCPGTDGGLVLLDRDATPYDVGGGYGSIYSIAADGSVSILALSPYFKELADIESEPDGYPLVADTAVDPFGFGLLNGAILRYNPHVSGKFVPLSSSTFFRTPCSFTIFGAPTPVELLEAAADSTTEGIRVHWRAGADQTGVHWLLFRRPATGPDDAGDATPVGYDPIAGDREFQGPGPHEFLDRNVEGGRWYVYLLTRVAVDGGIDYSSPLLAHAPNGVVRLELLPPAPSPFSLTTNLGFLVPAPGGRVRLDIFDVAGRRVRVLHDEATAPGRHVVSWDGLDDGGKSVASGVYFARLALGSDVRSRRLVHMR